MQSSWHRAGRSAELIGQGIKMQKKSQQGWQEIKSCGNEKPFRKDDVNKQSIKFVTEKGQQCTRNINDCKILQYVFFPKVMQISKVDIG